MVDLIVGLGGLRPGEALAIRVGDVDVKKGVVDITGTVVYEPGAGTRRQDIPKRSRQKRGLKLAQSGLGMRALRAAISEPPPHARRAGSPVLPRIESDASPWITPSIPFGQLKVVAKRPAVAAALAETGLLPRNLTPNVLRATVATLVARKDGADCAAVVLDHIQVRTTTTHYITPEGRITDLTLIDDVFV